MKGWCLFMFKIFLRALLIIVDHVITIPIKVLAFLAFIVLAICAKAKHYFGFRKSWSKFSRNAKESLKRELTFIKTGKWN